MFLSENCETIIVHFNDFVLLLCLIRLRFSLRRFAISMSKCIVALLVCLKKLHMLTAECPGHYRDLTKTK